VLDTRDDVDQLSRLHVRSHPHRQLGVAVNTTYSGSCHVSSRRIGTA
jgi:hypothetical protein